MSTDNRNRVQSRFATQERLYRLVIERAAAGDAELSAAWNAYRDLQGPEPNPAADAAATTEWRSAILTLAEHVGLHAEPAADDPWDMVLTGALFSYRVRSRDCGHCSHDVTRHLPDGRCRSCKVPPLPGSCPMFGFIPHR